MTKSPVPSRQSSSTRRRGRSVRTRTNRGWIWGVVAVGVLLFVARGILLSRNASGDIAGVETFDNLPRDHKDGPLTYPQMPPVGGAHNPVWQNCGIYNQPIRSENAVHALEHGAAWITYKPDLPVADIEQLRTQVRGRPYTLLSPYPDLPAPVVASAWGVQLKADSAADPQLAQFIAKYAQGPQTPEPGAPCSGGLSTPGGG